MAGIEPYIWLTDVGGVQADRAFEIMRANALAVLADVLGSSGSAP